MTRKVDSLLEDFTRAPVPEGKTVSGWRVALIVIGISIALPAFVSGAQMGNALGLAAAATAFLIGGVVLAVFGSVTAIVSAQARLTTYMLVQFAFGPQGARFVNVIFAITMFGWFGVNAALFGEAMMEALGELYGVRGWMDGYIIIGSVLMILTTVFGFKALDKLSLFAVPLLLVILISILAVSLRHASADVLFAPRDAQMTMGLAISAVVGANMVTAATMPDLSRYIVSRWHAVFGMILAFAIGGPIILMSAAVPSLATGEVDLMKIILGLGFGVPALFILVFSTWTSNAGNLYGAGLSLAATFPKIRYWKLTIVSGVLGTAVAVGGIVDVFIPFLIVLGITIPPIAGIFVLDFYFVARRHYDMRELESAPPIRWHAFVAWGLSSVVGFATATELLRFTTIPAGDALIVACVLYMALSHRQIRRSTAVAGKREERLASE